jgi:hypothetical protein
MVPTFLYFVASSRINKLLVNAKKKGKQEGTTKGERRVKRITLNYAKTQAYKLTYNRRL